ncbi:MAG: nucleotidyltransferase family protein [Candidatus Magnetobacterium sp. LHC-1]|uniref:Nucleotidyltransferase family protein n=1 Tax=Candidatus Magnetobacterium casense TaxID=1455061 RepID=A0ABS6RX53_9BACT|nr:nucleotidyltransferase family protein [Candidatus Magnetobacterium casensis]MBF0606385.1 nucleotidyltransferase family protein [Nitrospirota bacterium]MBV6341205.1 nucleotidyltransferase family protein [Candidatus Magnetobacterium casensis]
MDVIEILKSNEGLIRRRYGVSKIGVFGSFTRGQERQDSDVDVIVYFNEDSENFDNYIELKYFLEEAFGRNVDLVMVDALKPQLKNEILNEVVYVYA